MVFQKAKKFSLFRRHGHAAYFREIRHVAAVSSFLGPLRRFSFFRGILPSTVFAFRLVLCFYFINKSSFKLLNYLNQ